MLENLSIATLIYVATLAGAAAVAIALPRARAQWQPVGVVLGLGVLIGFWWGLAQTWPDALPGGRLSAAAFNFYYVFSAVALGAALMVISNTQPVYAALWFVVVVLATAGLLLSLGAEFVAFGMAIIYGGAILVTYMFVIMLATQSKAPERGDRAGQSQTPLYDRVAWEPVLGTFTGFVLLFCVLTVAFDTDRIEANPAAAMGPDSALVANALPLAGAGAGADDATDHAGADSGGHSEGYSGGHTGGAVLAYRRNPELARQLIDEGVDPETATGSAYRVSNSQHVGLDLFMAHPLGIELAGVILLVSLIGAVVIARRHVPDEEAAIRAERIAQHTN